MLLVLMQTFGDRGFVILSAAKDLIHQTQRSFAALRMTDRTACKAAHGKPYLHMSGSDEGEWHQPSVKEARQMPYWPKYAK